MWYSVVYIVLQSNTLPCCTLVSGLILGIGVTRGECYCILGGLFGIVLTVVVLLPVAFLSYLTVLFSF